MALSLGCSFSAARDEGLRRPLQVVGLHVPIELTVPHPHVERATTILVEARMARPDAARSSPVGASRPPPNLRSATEDRASALCPHERLAVVPSDDIVDLCLGKELAPGLVLPGVTPVLVAESGRCGPPRIDP